MLRIRAKAIKNLDDLKAALQNAIRLEHATIPPYLTAYMTLKGTTPGTKHARRIIQNIVVEEMLHMSLAANILNAIGGAPIINAIQKYPSPLPMGIGDDDGEAPGQALQVGLKRYSKDLVEKVFMQIEEPLAPLPVAALAVAEGPYTTIGEFYAGVRAEIRRQGDKIFQGGGGNPQVLGWFASGEVEVTDVASAERAIETIVQQGEGTTMSPVDLEGDIAHYYRFLELARGFEIDRAASVAQKKIVLDQTRPIVIDDANDVIQMVDNPQCVPIDRQTDWRAAQLSDECDLAYSRLLVALHKAFNGAPDKMGDALSLMFEFRTIAEELLQQRLSGSGQSPGPRFLIVPGAAA